MADKKTVTIMVRGVPADIHRRFKAQCALAGRTLSGAVLDYIEACVHAEEILEEKKRTVATK